MPIRYYSTNRYLNNVEGIVPFTAKVEELVVKSLTFTFQY